MRDILTDDHNLGSGWTLYTEYRPVDEDAGIWGWYWALDREDEGLEEPHANWQYLSASPRSLGNTDIMPPGGVFGPFGAEEIAKEFGISYCNRIRDDREQWGRLTSGE